MAVLTIAADPRHPSIVRVTINRPEVRNAFDEEVIAALSNFARDAAQNPTMRAVVLGGSGPAFCAGADLAWMMKAVAYTRHENLRDAEDLARMLERLDALRVPLIGRVQGTAIGGGAGLVAVCDMVAAADDAVFGFSEVKLGIIPAVISPYVVNKIGVSAARELFTTGARFSATRAREIGLVHTVVPETELDAAVDRYVAEILTSAPGAVSAAKRLIHDVHGRRPAEVIGMTTGRIAEQRTSAEGQEGMRAFLEKRKPRWVE